MQADDAEHVAGRFLDGDEGHGARVVDLRETRDERVAEFLHRREEPQTQVLRRDRGEERRIQPLVFGTHRPDQNLRSVAQLSVAFPFLRIGADGEAGMARRAAARRLDGSHRDAGIDGDQAVLVGQDGIEIELAQLGQIRRQLRQLDQQGKP